MWQFRRRPDNFNSGGPGSALYRTKDGGETWEKLTNGLPEGSLGQAVRQLLPCLAAVLRAIERAARTAGVEVVGPPPELPHTGLEDVRIAGILADVRAAGVLVDV